ncbi:hypothetical protein IWX47DRAFT_152477 [Phyllosticta citricarpa]|uniref:Uncharacterized protein n=1 Tax=Phyllosticta citricarpa TaxID=55181 RepID=A0ABR1MBR7_9PEZI
MGVCGGPTPQTTTTTTTLLVGWSVHSLPCLRCGRQPAPCGRCIHTYLLAYMGWDGACVSVRLSVSGGRRDGRPSASICRRQPGQQPARQARWAEANYLQASQSSRKVAYLPTYLPYHTYRVYTCSGATVQSKQAGCLGPATAQHSTAQGRASGQASGSGQNKKNPSGVAWEEARKTTRRRTPRAVPHVPSVR